MNYAISLLLSILSFLSCQQTATKSQVESYVITSDIQNFWEAYDQIQTTQDSVQQMVYLQELFLAKATPGLEAMMSKKRYTPTSYLEAIRNYPRFWKSIRPNTHRANSFAQAIEKEVEQLKILYPDLKPAKIYFTVGALMSGGTTMDDLVLIGSEIALADSTVVTDEFPQRLKENLRKYFDSNPIEDVVLLNVHEYVHTQQNTYGYDCLSQCLFEGVAEFIAVQSTGKPSVSPAIAFGKGQEDRVRQRFSKEMFSPNWNDWLYNNFENEFGERDLGYYVGYAISEKYFNAASDKKAAIKALLEVDYSNPLEVEKLVEESGYFKNSIASLKRQYEANRPEVIGIKEFKNGAQNVDPNLTQISIEFSKAMSSRFGGFEHGPLGKLHDLPITKFIGLSEDQKSMIYGIELKPNYQYQRQMTPVFRSTEGTELEPFLINFKTRKR